MIPDTTTCPIPGCTVPVGSAYIMCAGHWSHVPTSIRRALLYDSKHNGDARALVRARDAAIAAVIERSQP